MMTDERGPTGPRLVDIQNEFQMWLRAALAQRGMSDGDLAWRFPFQLHPKTVEAWRKGHGMPSYERLVGLALVLGELPPVLRELCSPAP